MTNFFWILEGFTLNFGIRIWYGVSFFKISHCTLRYMLWISSDDNFFVLQANIRPLPQILCNDGTLNIRKVVISAVRATFLVIFFIILEILLVKRLTTSSRTYHRVSKWVWRSTGQHFRPYVTSNTHDWHLKPPIRYRRDCLIRWRHNIFFKVQTGVSSMKLRNRA